MHIPILGSDQIADVTGAGDTVIATMTLALAAGATFEEAARLANYAGGIVVMKRGTATVTRRRAAAHAIAVADAGLMQLIGLVVSRERLVELVAAAIAPRGPDDRVRQRLLRPAARRPRPLPAGRGRRSGPAGRRGERRSRRRRAKGPGRPILPAAERAELVAALRGVDYVTIFPEPTVDAAAGCCGPTCTARGPTTPSNGAGARDRAQLRRAHRDRRRSEGSLDARSARADPRMNFLIVRLGALGDIVHAVPAAAALRAAYPGRAHRLARRCEAPRSSIS